jgi:hypothetical protein
MPALPCLLNPACKPHPTFTKAEEWSWGGVGTPLGKVANLSFLPCYEYLDS